MNIGQMLTPILLKAQGTGLMEKIYNATISNDNWKLYLLGIKNTLLMTLFALVLGVILGVVIAGVKYTHQSTGKLKVFNWFFNLYTTVVRGTPVLVQLMIIYHIIFAKSDIPRIIVAGLAFGLNSAAYVAEIIRGGINGVDKGQAETGRSLGLSHSKTMRLIILPQAVRNILPSLFNELISLFKETAVASTIGVMDIMFAGSAVQSKTYNAISLVIVAGVYLIIVIILGQIQKVVERRMQLQ